MKNNLYMSKARPGVYRLLFCLLVVSSLWTTNSFGTTLIPALNGSFESAVPTGVSATDFSANGWSVVNGANNQWYIGTAATPSAGTYSAFTGSSATSWTGQSPANVNHIYRDITFPAGESVITLTFKYKVGAADATFDYLKLWATSTSTTPVAGTQLTTTNATQLGVAAGYDSQTSYSLQTVSLPASFAGTTQRIVFSWRTDGFSPTAVLSVDEITLSSRAPISITSTSIGGLWSSPATWVGGVVPSGDDAIIAPGAIVTVDQTVNVRDLTVSGTLLWNGSGSTTVNVVNATGNVLVDVGGKINMFTAASAPSGTTIAVGGNFTNNGSVHAAYVSTAHAFINFNNSTSNPTLGGSGSFVGGIISQLFFATNGTSTITMPVTVRSFAHTAGTLNTNGNLSINNAAQVYGQPFNQQVYEIAVTGMGTGYNTANPPTVTIAAPTGTGVTATATPNIDDATGTLRSITIVNPGDGYRSNPSVTISGGVGSGATAIAVVNQSCPGLANSLVQKSGVAVINGTVNINSSQGVGGITSANGGLGYTSAPSVGFTLPTGYLNLVTNPGSGYSAVPTVSIDPANPGTFISGTTDPTFVAVVCRGQVVSVNCSSAGNKLWTVLPGLLVSTGTATAAFPAGCLPTATASISNGMVSDIAVNNAGFGYTSAPTVGLVGGGFGTAATAPTCRIGLYNLTWGFFLPATTNAVCTETGVMPANRRINILTMGGGVGMNVTGGDLDLYNSSPITLSGVLNMGGSKLTFSNPSYTGTSGSATSYVMNGSIQYNMFGSTASTSRQFPFATYDGTSAFANTLLSMGSATAIATEGSTITSITGTLLGAPSGSGNPIGTHTLRLQTNGGQYGNLPTLRLCYNSSDNLISDQQSLLIGQAAGITGPWTTRSVASGTGALPVAGNRTTATTGVGPFVPTGDDYFAWTSTFVPPAALNFTVSRTTGNPYNSIMPVAEGGNGLGLTYNFTFNGSSTDDNTSANVPIPNSTFMYQGSLVTAFTACTNGWVNLMNAYLSTSTSDQWTNQIGGAGPLRNALCPFWTDLTTNPNPGTVAALNNAMRYYISTDPIGSRKITMEWWKMTFFGNLGPELYFQVVLDESDNSITYNYGNMQMYNGTQNIRWSYTLGMNGGLVQSPALPGQVFTQQYENTLAFDNINAEGANVGANGLGISPEPRSSIKFTPGAYAGYTTPTPTAPLNDESADAIGVDALLAFPTNIAWNVASNTSNLFTTRYATHSPEAVCNSALNGTITGKDVWFAFNATDPNTTVRIYASGGFIPRVEVLDANLQPLSPAQCAVGTVGLTVNAVMNNLNPGDDYFVRVYHNQTGTTATATATVSGGSVTGVTVTNGGTNYTTCTNELPYTSRVTFSGGGGSGAVGYANVSGGVVTSITLVYGGTGYTSAPTVTVESPDWGPTGEFGIIVFAKAANDECASATTLTNLLNSNCTVGQNARNGVVTSAASQSTEASCSGTPDDDVWYKFTAINTNTNITVTGNANFDPVFEVWNAGPSGDCANKTSIFCRNLTGASGTEFATVPTIVNNIYYIRVYDASTGSGGPGANFNICISSAVPVCIANPTSPANNGNVCTGINTLSWPVSTDATGYLVYLDPGAGPATTLVATKTVNTDNTFTTSALSAGQYSWLVVPTNGIGPATGCTGWTFNAVAPPTVSIAPSPADASICGPGGGTVNLTATGATTYTWAPAAGLNTTNGASVTASPSSTTTYTVFGSNVSGCAGTATQTVVVNFLPGAPTTTNYNMCQGGSIPAGQGLTADCAGGTISNSLNINMTNPTTDEDNGTVGTAGFICPGNNIVSTFTLPALPPGATYSIAHLAISGITSGFPTENRLYFGGPGIIGSSPCFTGGSGTTWNTSAADEAVLAGLLNPAGGVVNIIYSESYNDITNGPDATFPSTASLSFTYNIPPTTVSWYSDPAGTNQVGAGSPFDPTLIAGGPDPNVPGSYTYYAACSSSPTCHGPTTAATLTIGATLVATASHTATSPICALGTDNLSVSVSGGGLPYSYSWSNGATVISTNASVTVNPSSTTTYTVTVTDNCNNSTTSSVTTTVLANPTIVITPTPADASICGTGSVSISVSGGTSYTWSPSSGLNTTTGSTVTASPSGTTTYTVTAANAAGCTSSATQTVTVNFLPSAPTTTSYNMCSGGSIPSGSGLTAECVSGTLTNSVTVNFTNVAADQGTTCGSGNVVASFTLPALPAGGTFLSAGIDVLGITLNTGSFGSEIRFNYSGSGTLPGSPICFQGITTTTTPNPADYHSGTPTASDLTTLAGILNPAGGTVVITYSETFNDAVIPDASFPPTGTFTYSYSVPASSVNWYSDAAGTNQVGVGSPFDPTLVAGGPNPNTPGTYTYYAACASTATCHSATTAANLIIGAPLTATASQTATSGICAAANNTLSVSVSGGGQPYSYSWSDGASVISTNATVVVNPSTTTTYTVTVTDACNQSTTSSVTTTVLPNPTIAVTPTSANSCVSSPSTITLTATGGVSYTWAPTGGSGSVIQVTPSTTTTYVVTGTGGNGCTASASAVVTVGNPINLTATATPVNVCSGGSSVLSAAGSIQNPAPSYCVTTQLGAPCITNVTFNTLSNSGVVCASPFYEDYPPTGTTTTQVFPGNTYALTVDLDPTGGAGIVSVWIDYNLDGTYDASEWNQVYTSASSGTINITIPPTASTGIAGMRIRSRLSGNINGAVDACTGFGSGSTQNYAITIGSPAAPSIVYTWSPATNLSSSTGTPVTASNLTNASNTYTVTATDQTGGCSATASVTVNVVPLSTPTISGSAAICAGATGTLNGTVTGGGQPYSYSWSNGASVVGTTASISVSPASSTTYTLTVTDNCGTTLTSSPYFLTVNPNPTVSVTGNPSSLVICSSGSVQLTASGANSTYNWTPIDGLDVTTGAVVNASPTATTTYTVVGTNVTGCTGTATITVTFSAGVTVTPTADQTTGCEPFTTTLHAGASTAGGYCIPTLGDPGATDDYLNNFTFNTIVNNGSGDAASDYTYYSALNTNVVAGNTYPISMTPGSPTWSEAFNAWIDYDQDGIFSASERVFVSTTAANNAVTQTGTVTIPATALNGTTRMRVECRFSSIPAATEACANPGFGEYEDYNVTISGGVNNVLSYSWTGSNLSSSTVAAPTVTNLATGSYTYTVTASNSFGCTASGTVSLTVLPAPPAPTITHGPLTFCNPGSVTLDAGAGYPSYSWSNGVSVVSTNQTYVATTSGTYSVTIGSANGCTASSSVVVNAQSATTPTITHGPLTFCSGGSVSLNAGNNNYNGYSWSDGVSVVSTSQTYVANTSGTYTVTVTDATTGCTASASATVVVNPNPPAPVVSPSGPISLSCDGANSSVLLDATIAGGYDLSWNNFDGSTTEDITVAFNDASFSAFSNPYGFQLTATDPVTGCFSLSNTVTITAPSCGVEFHSNIYLEAHYRSSTGLMDNDGQGGRISLPGIALSANPLDDDYVMISVVDPSNMNVLETQTGTLKTNGDIVVTFSSPSIVSGNSYWIKLNHESSVETWSAAPVQLNSVTTYLFSTNVNQSFGPNMSTSYGPYAAIYTGDINQDFAVDVSDYLILDPDIQGGNGGYVVTDLNGDGAVDVTDYLYLDPNVQAGVGAFTP